MANKYVPRTIRSIRLSAYHAAILDVVKKDIGYEWNNRAVGEALEVYYEVKHMNKEKKANKNNFIEVDLDIRKGDLMASTLIHLDVKDTEDVERFKNLCYNNKKVYLFAEEDERR